MYSEWLASQPESWGLILSEFNLAIFPIPPNRQIKNPTKFSRYMVLVQWYIVPLNFQGIMQSTPCQISQ